MAFDQIPTSVTILNSGLIGYQGISLTNFEASTESYIAAGSSVEISGAFFKATTNVQVSTTSWAAIATGTTAYLTLVPSGTTEAQILTAYWSSVASVWSTSKQGWYSSAGSSIRYVGSVYKGSNVQYLNKHLFLNSQDYQFRGIQELITTGSGNWIVPGNVRRIRVKCIGGGGGGGGTYGYGAGGGGGTQIGNVPWSIIDVTPNDSIAYSVGAGGTAGGAGVAGSAGGNGGNTTFTGATTGAGGGGGGRGSGGPGFCGLAPASEGGQGGGHGGRFDADTSGDGGQGGGSGGAGGHAGATTQGQDATGYGGGGGGGGAGLGGDKAGGAGGGGLIIIEY